MSLLKEASELASQCFSIANKFKSLYGSYQGAMGTLESLSSECNTTATMIMSIHGILVNKPATLSRNSSVIESFRDSITQCSRAVEELNKELSKYGNVGGVSERARFTINENHLKELLQTIRNQRSVVHFVVSCLQT
jgi:adenylosuccinate lyase